MPHSLDHARAWHAAGYGVVIVVIVDTLDQSIDTSPLDFADGLLLRVNRGRDFGAWAAAIQSLEPSLRNCSVLTIANDSVVGPSSGFSAMIDRVEKTHADLVGLVESKEQASHFQSFVLFFKGGALRSRVFQRFWGAVRSGDRGYVITKYELTLRARFEAAGLRTQVLHPAGEAVLCNQTLNGWRALLDAGFPYLKVQLLRDNTDQSSLADWRGAALRSGFDLPSLEHQITQLEKNAKWRWAYHIADQE